MAFARITATGIAILTTLALAGCSDDSSDGKSGDSSTVGGESNNASEAAEPATVLNLEDGAALTLPGANNDGQITDETPFNVAFDTMTCDTTFPKAANSDDYSSVVDLEADAGNQICIIELAVTNESSAPGTFTSEYSATARTTDGIEFSASDKNFMDQDWLHAKDREPSYTTDAVQPGSTKYDVVAYEIPADATLDALVYSITTYSG